MELYIEYRWMGALNGNMENITDRWDFLIGGWKH